MKKILFTMIALLSAGTATADNDSYFTMGVNDTVLIHPTYLGQSYWVPVKAHFVSRFDSWIVYMNYPVGLSKSDHLRGSGLDVPYVKSDGTQDIYHAVLTINNDTTVFSSTITEFGYWDFDHNGSYEPYGTVKWEPGDYDNMYSIKLDIAPSFRQDSIIFNGELTSTYDWRGGTDNVLFHKSVVLKIGYCKGDVNGDGYIDSGDVTLLIAIVTDNRSCDEFQFEAGDINGDGVLDIIDVTAVIALALSD